MIAGGIPTEAPVAQVPVAQVPVSRYADDLPGCFPPASRPSYRPRSELTTGELIVNERQLPADLGLHRNVKRRWLRDLADNAMIGVIRDQAPRTAGTKIAILNYHQYRLVDGCKSRRPGGLFVE